ncbi:MAG: hypothetical protein JWO38_1748 [Gemmataceae bacterium]|nr:hypothetical protein [Gemmataceae bacterium]
MHPRLVGAILLASVIAGTLSEIALYRISRLTDLWPQILGWVWVAMPYLVAVGLAFLLRRNTVGLVVLLIALLLVAPVGVFLLDDSVTQQAIAEQQARDSGRRVWMVKAGPDGADGPDEGVPMHRMFSKLWFSILPTYQLAAVVIPTGIGYGFSVWLRWRQGRAGDRPANRGLDGWVLTPRGIP